MTTRAVPAATATLQILRFLSSQPAPVPAAHIARSVDLPRSSTYHLLSAMADQQFVVHYPDSRAWGIGIGAWEVGQAFAAQEPLARLGRIPLARLVDTVGHSCHLVMLHGNEVVYIIEERAPGRPPLVTDVGVRLPAHLTASGRAILAILPPQQVRAVFPNHDEFTTRTGSGPTRLSELRRLLTQTRHRGYATEDGEVTAGFSSMAAVIPAGSLLASVAITWPNDESPPPVDPLLDTAQTISARLR